MAITDKHLVRRLLYDLVGGQRFTQDTPIMPDVWMAFAAAPQEPQDLILTPTRDTPAGKVARELRWLLDQYREADLGLLNLQAAEREKHRPRLAHLPGRITVKIFFDELMRIVLALTPWWKLRPQVLRLDREGALRGFPDPEDGDEGAMTAALITALENARTHRLGQPRRQKGHRAPAEPTPDLVWVVRLAGAIALSCEPRGTTFDSPESFHEGLRKYLGSSSSSDEAHVSLSGHLARSFLDLYRGWPVESPPENQLLWRVTLNRRAKATIKKSALTVKADAARLLFEVSCRRITWAIVDSGIDGDHPAFRNHEAKSVSRPDTLDESRPPLPESEGFPMGGARHPSRVVHTFDFRDLRELLDPYVMAFFGEPEEILGRLDDEIGEMSRALGDGLRQQGDQIEGLRGKAGRQAEKLPGRLWRRLLADWRGLAKLLLVIPGNDALRTRLAGHLRQAPDPGGSVEAEKRDAGQRYPAFEETKKRLKELKSLAKESLERLEATAAELRRAIENDEASSLLEKLEGRRTILQPGETPEIWRLRQIVGLSEIFDDLAELYRRIELGHENDWGLLERFVEDRNPAPPKNEHGTHVAGILGADWRDPAGEVVMKGICPDIRLVDVRVLRDDGESDEFEVMAAIQYLRYRNSRAGYMDVHGANLSLSIHHVVADYACGRTPICEECEEAVALGMAIVAAAGNRGFVQYETAEGPLDGYSTVSVTDPGNAEAVITVGSTHRTRAHEYGVSYFSSRGPTGDGRIKPDLVAPGEKIKAPIPGAGDAYKDGTSMAAPHVSGAAAMLMARYKELIGKPERIKRILCDTATDLGRERYFQGAGMLDILRALQSI